VLRLAHQGDGGVAVVHAGLVGGLDDKRCFDRSDIQAEEAWMRRVLTGPDFF